jgi:hypothetical protein
MSNWKRYNSLLVASTALFGLSFKYQGEGILLDIEDPNSYISFVMIWRSAASILAVLWVAYLIFNRRLHSETLTRLHVLGSMFCALLFISYSMWMNSVDSQLSLGLTAMVFLLSQLPFAANLIKGAKNSKTNTAKY